MLSERSTRKLKALQYRLPSTPRKGLSDFQGPRANWFCGRLSAACGGQKESPGIQHPGPGHLYVGTQM